MPKIKTKPEENYTLAEYASIGDYLAECEGEKPQGLEWRRSAKGNLWARLSGDGGSEVTVTVFQGECGDWRTCLADTTGPVFYWLGAGSEAEAVEIVETALNEKDGRTK